MQPLYRSNAVVGFVGKAYRRGRAPASEARPRSHRPGRGPALVLAAILATALAHAPAAAQTPERSARFAPAQPSRPAPLLSSPQAATAAIPLAPSKGAQEPSEPQLRWLRCETTTGPCVLTTAVGALGGAALGALAGGAVLGAVGLAAGSVELALGGAVYGGMAGGVVGMPLGAHRANERRGSLVLDYLIPLGLAAYASTAAQKLGWRESIVIPVTLFGSVVATEIITGR